MRFSDRSSDVCSSVLGFIQYIASFVDDAILTLTGIGNQRHISQDTQLGKALLERCHHPWDQAWRVGRFDSVMRLQAGINNGKQRDHGNAKADTDRKSVV